MPSLCRYCQCMLRYRIMIEIISYIVIAFCYRKASILHRWSNILCIFYRNMTCVTSADLIDSDENLHCFKLPLSSCYIKISVVSQCRCTAGISWLFILWTHSCLCDWQLAPAGQRSDLVTVDADWHRLNLLTDSRLTSQETQKQIWNWLRQAETAATQYTRSTLPTNSTQQAAPASTMAEQLHPQQLSRDDTIWGRYVTYEISRNCLIILCNQTV